MTEIEKAIAYWEEQRRIEAKRQDAEAKLRAPTSNLIGLLQRTLAITKAGRTRVDGRIVRP